jgi:hypothetical protein
MNRILALLALIVSTATAQQTIPRRALDAYYANKPDSAAALFRAAVREHPRDARLHAWLAEAALRSGNSKEASQAADDALGLDPCNAQAHLVRAYLFMPRYAQPAHVSDDSTWTHLMEAVRCDPRDGNAWSYVWKYAIMRRDTTAESRALRALVTTGYLTRPQITYASWVLRSLPPRAVLLTGGDMDTYAPLAAQVALGVRRDVAVINTVMLSGKWYSEPVLARHHIGPVADVSFDPSPDGAKIFIASLRHAASTGTLGRPLAFAITAPVDTPAHDSALQLAGPYWLVVPPGTRKADSAKIVASLRAADSLDWRGPATASSDRSPVHRLYDPAPGELVKGVAALGRSLLLSSAATRTIPASGTDLLQRMHDVYAGKWYRTLTFVQKTTLTRPTGVVDTSTWYEALKSPDRLRIDFGDPANGNGALYTADSLYVVRGGKITRTVASGNPFLPFVAGVYDQPLETTLRQLAPYHFDLSRIRADSWQGRPVYVVGATSPDDLESPQFWIDRDRLVAVRFLVKLSPAPDAKADDIRLESYVPVSGGWLATHVAIMQGTVVRQAEDYRDWHGDVPLPNDFFVAEKWSEVPHWFRGKQ